jgi:nitroreductase
MQVDEAIVSRRSVRAFLPDPVPQETIEHILKVAARAPSGTNTQPWWVQIVTGEVKEAITKSALELFDAGEAEEVYKYYPDRFPEPYISRRRKVGWDMYALVGIERGESEKMHVQHGLNYRFFGAPVGLFFFIDKALEIGSWLDYGMFLQNVMTAARGQGLHTCPQAAWPRYHKAVRKHLDVDDSMALVAGMSMGYEDTSAPINALRTEREPVETFARFVGF